MVSGLEVRSSAGGRPWALVVGVFFASLSTAGLDAQEPYAPWAALRATPPGYQSAAQLQATVPARSDVEVPPYPGAVVISAAGRAGEGQLPFINLVTEDPVPDVVAFYKERLLAMDGWQWHELFEIFYKGDAVDPAMAMQAPMVNVMENSPDAADMTYVEDAVKATAKTRIQVVYEPER